MNRFFLILLFVLGLFSQAFAAEGVDLGQSSEPIALGDAEVVLGHPTHPDYEWLKAVAPRVGVLNKGSFAIWGKTRGTGVPLIVTAGHVVNKSENKKTLLNPLTQDPEPSFGKFLQPLRTWVDKPFGDRDRFYPRSLFSRILIPKYSDGADPREDFSVLVGTGMKVKVADPVPKKIFWGQHTDIEVEDASNYLDFEKMKAPPEVQIDEKLIVVSAPAGQLQYSIGHVLSNVEVQNRGWKNPEAWEFVVDGRIAIATGKGKSIFSMPGMSGSGVFNSKGELVGILNGLSVPKEGVWDHFRATRLSYVAKYLRAKINALPPSERVQFINLWNK